MVTVGIEDIDLIHLFFNPRCNIHQTNSFGQTALHFAASVGNTEAIKLLLENHANINQVDNDGNTALSLAIKSKNPVTVALLQAKGAKECKSEQKSPSGKTEMPSSSPPTNSNQSATQPLPSTKSNNRPYSSSRFFPLSDSTLPKVHSTANIEKDKENDKPTQEQ